MIPTLPVTEASVAAAKAAMYRERWETGLPIDADGKIQREVTPLYDVTSPSRPEREGRSTP